MNIQIISSAESATVEFKQAWNENIRFTLCSANKSSDVLDAKYRLK